MLWLRMQCAGTLRVPGVGCCMHGRRARVSACMLVLGEHGCMLLSPCAMGRTDAGGWQNAQGKHAPLRLPAAVEEFLKAEGIPFKRPLPGALEISA